MRRFSLQGARLHHQPPSTDTECRQRLAALMAGLPEPQAVRTVLELLEALYQARGWPLPGSRTPPPSLYGLVLSLYLLT